MKIDMHCHVKEGSIDSKVSLEDYITLLKKKGFQGMVITDHNTYNGYRYWKNHMKGKVHTDFVVLKGIEYDTRDAGHILVIMPEGVKMRLLEMRGMPVILWACINMREPITGPQWKLKDSGEVFTWISNEHCMLLVGYDEEGYYFNDPYENNGVIRYPKEIVEDRYKAQHMQAVAVKKK